MYHCIYLYKTKHYLLPDSIKSILNMKHKLKVLIVVMFQCSNKQTQHTYVFQAV